MGWRDQLRHINCTHPEQGITRISIENPPLNLLTQAVRQELGTAFEQLQFEEQTRVVIFGKAHSNFCAGADLTEFPQRFDPLVALQHGKNAHRMILALLSLSKPVIALIDGNCMGGGLELALACDYRIGSNSVRLALPEIKRGVWPGTGGIFLLQNLVGRAQAHRILLGGNILDATQAAGLGLLDEHPPQDQLDTRVLEFCAEIANRPLSSIKTICTLLDHQLLDSFKAHLRFELEQFVQAYQQPAAREGNLAFFEKRPPQWH